MTPEQAEPQQWATMLRYERMGVSSIKVLNADRLRGLTHVLVIERHSDPLAVIVPYGWYSQTLDRLKGAALVSPAPDRVRALEDAR